MHRSIVVGSSLGIFIAFQKNLKSPAKDLLIFLSSIPMIIRLIIFILSATSNPPRCSANDTCVHVHAALDQLENAINVLDQYSLPATMLEYTRDSIEKYAEEVVKLLATVSTPALVINRYMKDSNIEGCAIKEKLDQLSSSLCQKLKRYDIPMPPPINCDPESTDKELKTACETIYALVNDKQSALNKIRHKVPLALWGKRKMRAPDLLTRESLAADVEGAGSSGSSKKK